jgi:tetratricopeptide (TPR) repeat protein
LLGAVAGLLAGGPPPARAHGELHDLIVQATKDIEKNPRDPLLYLKRADLHRAHLGWDTAMADIERAAMLTNQWPQLNLDRAALYLDAQWFESAVIAAGRYLDHAPTNTLALLIRARARAKLGMNSEAAEDYTRTIKNTREPGPELFVERANAQTADTNLTAALQGLEEGLSQLGPIVTLQLAAIEVEIRQKQVDAAVARLDAIIEKAPRKETWLARRGDILRQAGRPQEAAASYLAALQALEALPPVRRQVPAMVELEKQIRAGLSGRNP